MTLTLTVMSGGTLDEEQLAGRVADVFKNGPAPARERIAELTAARLVETGGDGRIHATEAGQALWTRLRGVVTGITEELWGDLPAEDLAVTGRVLSVVLDRANVVLAAA